MTIKLAPWPVDKPRILVTTKGRGFIATVDVNGVDVWVTPKQRGEARQVREEAQLWISALTACCEGWRKACQRGTDHESYHSIVMFHDNKEWLGDWSLTDPVAFCPWCGSRKVDE